VTEEFEISPWYKLTEVERCSVMVVTTNDRLLH